MKGIVLAGGKGSRLYPLTLPVSKQLLPLYDKPMIYYPLATLMQAGIQEILVITDAAQEASFRRLLGDGSQWGMGFTYVGQAQPRGIAEALILADPFLADEDFIMIFGDNLFHGAGLSGQLAAPLDDASIRAVVYAQPVKDPARYGVITIREGRPVQIVEKPEAPESNLAVTGLYKYSNTAVEIAKGLAPSARGELEITDVNNHFLGLGQLACVLLGPGYAWLDTGTPEAILQAGQFIHALQERQGVMVACLEEIAYTNGWISKGQLAEQAAKLTASEYGLYLKSIVERDG